MIRFRATNVDFAEEDKKIACRSVTSTFHRYHDVHLVTPDVQ